LKQISSELTRFFGDTHLSSVVFPDWDAIFSYIRSHQDRRVIIAWDEFPYLVKEDPSLLSVIQYHWDTWLKDSQLFLIVSGSSISMMEEMTMRYVSPLFGRRTGQYLIKPLRFTDILEHFPDLTTTVEHYAVFGGTPAYIFKADKNKDIYENIISRILTDDSILFQDTEFILMSEVSEPRYYFSILRAIAEGNTTPSKISQMTGLERATVSKYLQVLINLHLIIREIPAGEPLKSKKGQYFLSDNYFAFWFRYVSPFAKSIEMGDGRALCVQEIKPTLQAFIGKKFEGCIEDLLWKLNTSALLPFRFHSCSRWWMKEHEIDLIASGDTDVLFCEVKWQDKVNAGKIYSNLLVKSEIFLSYHPEFRNRHYLVIAKTFTRESDIVSDKVHAWNTDTLEEMYHQCRL
jgi:AAA+ ATPase superfamily predicted ATPase